jgi:tripartite-type tricarboxylate transporter receptor subunit TctC
MRLATVLGRIISTSTLWLVVATSGVQAQDFPCRAITIVVDSGIGSGTDVVMRAFVDQVNRRGGSIPPFKVVNRIGKQTLTEFAGEPPSGCRLMAVTQSIVAERLARDTTLEWSDFTPVANLTRSPMVLAARTDLEPKPLPEILQASRGQSRKFSIGETDNALERFFLRELEDAAGVTFERRLFETMRQRYTALLAGDLDLAFVSVLAASRRGD